MAEDNRNGSLSLEDAILYTAAYADVFDYPLTVREIHRYLAYRADSQAAVIDAIVRILLPRGRLAGTGAFLTLPGREALVAVRARRIETARRLWPEALRFGRIIAGLPFVRLTAVTGALAMDNVEPEADIDYFIVTATGRVWLCRAMLIALVKTAARSGITICPNYLVSERALVLPEQGFYSAHELAQMVPLSGPGLYERIRGLNPWTRRFLPNADGAPQVTHELAPAPAPRRWTQSALEFSLRLPPVDGLERWEMRRKIRKLSRGPGPHVEASFGPDWCKGHLDDHGLHAERALHERVESLQIQLR